MENPDMNRFLTSLLILMEEAYIGPPNPRGTWFADNDPKAGLIGTLSGVTAAEASVAVGDGTTIAAHTYHLKFALDLANRAFRGEDSYASADWPSSWLVDTVDEKQWNELRAELKAEYDRLVEILRTDAAKDVLSKGDEALTGTIALIGHGAWHLGAIRKMIEVVRSPREE